MNDREEEVININDAWPSTAIEMTNPDFIALESAPAQSTKFKSFASVFSFGNRIVLGSAMLICLIVPFIAGMYMSYSVRRYLHDPIDPDNIWPETKYNNMDFFDGIDTDDPGYSTNPNNMLLIKNDSTDYFIFNNGKINDLPYYMSVYMIENLYGDRNKFGLYFIINSDKKSIQTNEFTANFINNDNFLNGKQNWVKNQYNDNLKCIHPVTAEPAAIVELFENLRQKNSNYHTIEKRIASDIQAHAHSIAKSHLYDSIQNTFIYAFPIGGSNLPLPLFVELQKYRNDARDLMETFVNSSGNEHSRIELKRIKPRFSKICDSELISYSTSS